MSGYLLDTNVIIDFLKGRPQAVELMQQIGSGDVCLCTVVAAEVLEGFARRNHPSRDLAMFESYLAEFTVFDFDIETARDICKNSGATP